MKRKLFLMIIGVIAFATSLLTQPIYAELFKPAPKQPVCPLSDKQQQDSQREFAFLEKMIKSDPPRCINCHGGVQPLEPNTNHMGGRQKPIFNKKGRIDIQATAMERCILCHDQPWFAPAANDFWVGRTTAQLCKQLKKHFNNGATAFLGHFKNDVFADIGFTGTRALNDVAQLIYEGEAGKPYKPEPPSFEKKVLIGSVLIFIEANGGKFQGDESCGCEPHHYAFKVSADSGFSNPALFQGSYKGHADFKIPIKFNDDGSFGGETKVDFSYSGTSQGEDFTCSHTMLSQGEIWKATGKVDDRGEMRVTFTIKTPPAQIKGECTGSFGTIPSNGTIPGGEWSTNADLFAVVGETTAQEWKNPEGGFLNVQFTIIEEGQ